jgi:hypothetical protein
MTEATFAAGGLTIRVHVHAEDVSKAMQMTAKQLDAALVETQNGARAEAIRELQYATSTWTHQPAFKGTVWHRGSEFTTKVSTGDQTFIYVDQGTKPHIIAPKREGYPLAFQSGYKAKSAPGILRAYKGGAFGSMVYAMHVHHPGTKARKFMDKVQEKVSKWAGTRLRQLVKAVVAKH